MKTTCLVNNYNYARFVREAVDSALRQTVPFDEIIVVDDGSTDGSVGMLKDEYGGHPIVRIVAKANQGQLSCFNEGFAQASGEVVFVLDADDIYEPNYVERALDVYARIPSCDFVFCGRRGFGRENKVTLDYPRDRDLGYSVILTAYCRQWIGGSTSCLSMRRGVLEKILPLPFTDDWWSRADDCLVFGASLAGARKYYIAQPLVRYRVHDSNAHCGNPRDRYSNYRRRLAINVLFEHLEKKLEYNVTQLAAFHHREFCTIGRPGLRQLALYAGIGMSSRSSLLRRLGCLGTMTIHYLREAVSAGVREQTAPPANCPSPKSLRVPVPSTGEAKARHASPKPPRAA